MKKGKEGLRRARQEMKKNELREIYSGERVGSIDDVKKL